MKRTFSLYVAAFGFHLSLSQSIPSIANPDPNPSERLSYSLNCRQCPIALLDICVFGSDITCDNSTQVCYRGNAEFNGTLPVRLYTRGCLDRDLCELTLNGLALGAPYTARFDCCVTDLCNGATPVQLSLTMAVGVALFSLWVV
ncbi:lymphocyte antigen-6, epidermis [Dunckerocampus dactyliophorus]|uniref:lymphocyte antigen-6, epidermis n=1 Tax=Dunckerocampus dactyliophorus TaxID=161453 RepID=UPI0024075037|nr:lymphocyte antigen-6, epidermis [Dunckerocampus dactyliophorus]